MDRALLNRYFDWMKMYAFADIEDKLETEIFAERKETKLRKVGDINQEKIFSKI